MQQLSSAQHDGPTTPTAVLSPERVLPKEAHYTKKTMKESINDAKMKNIQQDYYGCAHPRLLVGVSLLLLVLQSLLQKSEYSLSEKRSKKNSARVLVCL